MLKVSSLYVNYANITALSDISVEVGASEIICVLGPNGAGKTSLIRSICGQVPVAAGSIHFDGEDITGLSPVQVVKRGIIQCPEGRQTFNSLSVQENLVAAASRFRMPYSKMKTEQNLVFNLFPRLKERLTQKAGTLSGGEQQMLALARSLVARPRLLLLDEPSLGLAPVLTGQVFRAIERIAANGIAMILVEQNAHMALQVAHRGYILRSGVLLQAGRSETLQAYLETHSGYLQ